MNLSVIGCSFRTAPVELRERLAFDEPRLERALAELTARYGCEAVLLSTCNRVELFLAREESGGLDADLIAEFLGECQQVPTASIRPHLYEHRNEHGVRHLFRVVASLDSMVLGEGQIAGQTKRAYELASRYGTAGPYLHALFQHARLVAKRVRTETGISQGHVSVSSVAVEYVRQVFGHFNDKTVLVIGAGKMGELTLRHLRDLRPRRILVTNRSPEKAVVVAKGCEGTPVPWADLDDALVKADIVLSTTGAPEPVVTLDRYRQVAAKRSGQSVVILDIAIPRDFDPRIHDGEQTFLFNIDDLTRIREETLSERQRHVGPAEAIIDAEQKRFLTEWARKRNGPLIAKLRQEFDAKRQEVVRDLLGHLNGKLTDADRKYIEGAFQLLQNRLLHGPISALADAAHEVGPLREALRKLFRLQD